VPVLRVIVDPALDVASPGVARYSEELTRALAATAPEGTQVEGVISAAPELSDAALAERIPGLARLHRSRLDRRELVAAWQHGFTLLPGDGMVHAPSLLAPLGRRDRTTGGRQIVVTVHDAGVLTAPGALSPAAAAWQRTMITRAERYADAVVVPSHAVAADLAEHTVFGDRVRVISGAGRSRPVAPSGHVPPGLPLRYIAAIGTIDAHKGIEPLIRALADLPDDVSLVLAGPETASDIDVDAVVRDAGVATSRIHRLGYLPDDELAALLRGAQALVVPSLVEGFGLALLEAFQLGVPVVHSDAPALLEVSADSGLPVTLHGGGYAERLAVAIRRVLDEPELADRMRVAGRDRARMFDWRDSARQVWQLHADL